MKKLLALLLLSLSAVLLVGCAKPTTVVEEVPAPVVEETAAVVEETAPAAAPVAPGVQ